MVSFEEYRTAVGLFLEVSDCLNDGWTRFQTVENSENRISIRKRQTIFCKEPSNTTKNETETENENENEHDFSDDQKDSKRPSSVLIFEYHIIFNEAFAVPQLLFNAVRTDGSLVPLSLLHDLIPQYLISENADSDSVWSTLSQIEHPILHCPIYALHPCQTENFIRKIRDFSEKWFVSWLSSIGPAVGLRLDPRYGFTQTNS